MSKLLKLIVLGNERNQWLLFLNTRQEIFGCIKSAFFVTYVIPLVFIVIFLLPAMLSQGCHRVTWISQTWLFALCRQLCSSYKVRIGCTDTPSSPRLYFSLNKYFWYSLGRIITDASHHFEKNTVLIKPNSVSYAKSLLSKHVKHCNFLNSRCLHSFLELNVMAGYCFYVKSWQEIFRSTKNAFSVNCVFSFLRGSRLQVQGCQMACFQTKKTKFG
jgi:hypothetical protein